MTATRLPSFQRPPLVETVLGVQFDPISKLTNAHLGAFWKRLGPDWPYVEDAPPVKDQFEHFGEGRAWGLGELRLELMQQMPQRIQIRNTSNDRMVQLQNGRLLYNWIRSEAREYPRYETIVSEFEKLVERFTTFLADEHLRNFASNQWEVTYVNNLPKGTIWQDSEDWVGLFRWPAAAPAAIPRLDLESASASWHYEIPPQRGRLHVQLAHRKEAHGNRPESLTLTLTARGPTANEGSQRMPWRQGLDVGHEAIVWAFHDLTSEQAHRFWGIE